MAERRSRRWLRRGRGTGVPSGAGGPLEPRDGAQGWIDAAAGVRLWCRVRGDGPATVVVMCTGNAGDLAGLAGDGRRTVFVDARCRGRSDCPGSTPARGFDALVADLDAVRRSVDAEVVSVVASSYLAGAAAQYALAHPDRVGRLVLVAAIPPYSAAQPRAASPPDPAALAALDQLDAAGARERDPEAYCRAWRRAYVPLQMGRPERFAAMADPCDCPNEWPWRVAPSVVLVLAQLGRYDWRPALRALHVPTLVVHGSRDAHPVEVAHEWADALGDARLLELDGVGQLPWVEEPERFFGVVTRFLGGEPV